MTYIDFASMITEEQKEAFRKGDKYYVSPFKNMKMRNDSRSSNGSYISTSYSRIHEARMDSISSRQWN